MFHLVRAVCYLACPPFSPCRGGWKCVHAYTSWLLLLHIEDIRLWQGSGGWSSHTRVRIGNSSLWVEIAKRAFTIIRLNYIAVIHVIGWGQLRVRVLKAPIYGDQWVCPMKVVLDKQIIVNSVEQLHSVVFGYLHPSVWDVKSQIEGRRDRTSGKYNRGGVAGEEGVEIVILAIRKGEGIFWLVPESFFQTMVNGKMEILERKVSISSLLNIFVF